MSKINLEEFGQKTQYLTEIKVINPYFVRNMKNLREINPKGLRG